jgi:aminoglycoside phosphotransferase
MRLSLLLEREPFPQILEKTLTHFWGRHFEREISVRWVNGRAAPQPGEQVWLVNAYLNAIFVPEAEPPIFDPIRREFSRSLVWWKRPLQRAYVHLAAAPPTARLLAQARLHVAPPIPQAKRQLLVGGNHKIRWLQAGEGVAYGICKAGFDNRFMRQEIAARQQAAACGLPVPALRAVDPAGNWFAETYLSGTPLNRLADAQAAETAVQQIMAALERLYAATETTTTVGAYAAHRHAQIQALIQPHHLLAAADKARLSRLADRLLARVAGSTAVCPLALTHGDCQPGNILCNEDGAWLIDWEYAGLRQRDYDRLTLALQSRFPVELADRLQAFLVEGWPAPWRSLWAAVGDREARITLFLLEEICLHLDQICQPPLIQAGSGLAALTAACDNWLQEQKEENFANV